LRVLILQLVPPVRGRGTPRFDPQLGTLIRLLRTRDHEVSLASMTRYDLNELKAALARSLPQIVLAQVSAIRVDAARRAFQYIEQREYVPIVAGGEYPTVDPAACLSLPGVQAIAIGEFDASLVTYLERLKDPAVGQIVQGIWLRDERGLAQPRLPAIVEDLDSLPLADRDLFHYDRHVRETGEIEISIGRGCPQKCGYCLLPAVAALYGAPRAWVRRRSPEHVIAEVLELRDRYAGANRVRFLDHHFALDPEWLHTLLDAYAAGPAMPFACHLRANAVSRETVQALRAAGCHHADLEIISGSDFVRNEIFGMELSREQIVEAMAHLRDAGVRTRAIVYLGAPYDSEAAFDELFSLLRTIKPDVVDARPYYPWPGTAGRATAIENGWLHPRGEEQYVDEACGIAMPACRPEIVAATLRRLRREFPVHVGDPWWRRWSAVSRAAFGRLLSRSEPRGS